MLRSIELGAVCPAAIAQAFGTAVYPGAWTRVHAPAPVVVHTDLLLVVVRAGDPKSSDFGLGLSL